MNKFIPIIRKIVPGFVFSWYHFLFAVMANVWYGFPTRKITIIGITGTAGKTTASNVLANIMDAAGYKIGLATTANFKIADKEWENTQRMTMVGRFQLQKLIADAVKQGCTHFIVETTSEGIKQWRHWGIAYDVLLFTLLFPEHLKAHSNSYEKYKNTKLKIFKELMKQPKKVGVAKQIVVNANDKEASDFAAPKADERWAYSQQETRYKKARDKEFQIPDSKFVTYGDVAFRPGGMEFQVSYGELTASFSTKIMGAFNAAHITGAITLALSLGLKLEDCVAGVERMQPLPGRMQIIQEEPFQVIVEYAFLPKSFEVMYEMVEQMPKNRVIHVFGCAGGGRDTWKRPVMGKMAAENADVVILTDEDMFEDDPSDIIDGIAKGCMEGGAKEVNSEELRIKNSEFRDNSVFTRIVDREEAIKLALEIAQPRDLVLITGKGAERKRFLGGGQVVEWSDEEVARKFLNV